MNFKSRKRGVDECYARSTLLNLTEKELESNYLMKLKCWWESTWGEILKRQLLLTKKNNTQTRFYVIFLLGTQRRHIVRFICRVRARQRGADWSRIKGVRRVEWGPWSAIRKPPLLVDKFLNKKVEAFFLKEVCLPWISSATRKTRFLSSLFFFTFRLLQLIP